MKKAFTLAEIISVLVIMGIVAAITIPTTIIHHQKKQTITRLKLAYSILTKLTDVSYVENGGMPPGLHPNDDTDWNKFVKPYISISKDCGLTGTGCFAGPGGGMYTSQGTPITSGTNQFHKVVLKNGMSLAFRACSNCYQSRNIFVVDIDGPNKGYSKFGQDVFMFDWVDPARTTSAYNLKSWNWKEAADDLYPDRENKEDNSVNCENIPQSGPSIAPWMIYCIGRSGSGGWYSTYRNANLMKRYCLKGDGTSMAVPHGATCAGWIINNDWKIPEGYPLGEFNKKPEGFQRP